MTTVVLLVAAFITGLVCGVAFTARNTHRIVGRLPKHERIAFARKVAAVARDR